MNGLPAWRDESGIEIPITFWAKHNILINK